MARSTQFVGLNQPALDFVKGLSEIGSSKKVWGMFNEEYPLKKWVDHFGNVFQEELQISYWSSCLVMLTHLKMTFANEISVGHCFSWVRDPSLLGVKEVDLEKGRFWI